ncbi:MAG: esterase-like activity of phytase family protein [Pontixanthobacter sp.]
MIRRLTILALVAISLAPGSWIRTPAPVPNDSHTLTLTSLDIAPRRLGETTLVGGWHLTSANSGFGSYSALVSIGSKRFLAGSDRGRLLEFDRPDMGAPPRDPVLRMFPGSGNRDKSAVDLESLTRAPATGTIWAGFEGRNTIQRIAGDYTNRKSVFPNAMADWASNSGAESLVRLANGRFLVISEGTALEEAGTFPTLLFDRDPMEGGTARRYFFQPPRGYRPVDATQLPDGRILALVRTFTIALPPRFAVKIVLLDPAELDPARPWRGRTIAAIDDPVIADNYEGLATTCNADGTIAIWLISDDNDSIYQRTLLLKLLWPPPDRKDLRTDTQKGAQNPSARPLMR